MILHVFMTRRAQSAVRSQVALKLCVNLFECAFLVYWTFVVGIIFILGHNFTDANWLAWQTALTIGYGTNLPEEWKGKWFTMIMGTWAVLMSTGVFGAILNLINERQARLKGGFMKNPHKNGYVIFGFPGERSILELVRQIRTTEPDVPFCVVDHKLDELPAAICELPAIHFVRGDLLRTTTYEKAAIAAQKGIVIYPLDRHDPNSDAATAGAVRLIEKFFADQKSVARVVHNLVDPDNAHLFGGLLSQEIPKNATEFLISQEFQGQGTARLLVELMRNDQGEDPQTCTPSLTVGMTWGELMTGSLRLYQGGEGLPFNPLSLLRDSHPIFHPAWSEVICADDRICVIADNAFDWTKAEEALTGKRRGTQAEDFAHLTPV